MPLSIDIEIDSKFKSSIPALSKEERQQLEQNIIDYGGARDPLIVWQEKNILVDGHNRYEICTRLNLPYEIKAVSFDSREKVCDWIDANQLGRRNLSPDAFRLLLGRRYNRMKKAQGGTGAHRHQQSGKIYHSVKTADTLAAEHGVTEKTVRNAGKFAEEVEQTPELQQAINDRVPVAKVQKQQRKIKQEKEEYRVKVATEKISDVQIKTKCEPGQIWHLGVHRLYCGDTSKSDFQKLCSSFGTAALAFADPPYGANKTEEYNDQEFYWEHDFLLDIARVAVVTPGISSIFDFSKKTKMEYQWSLSCWVSNGMTRGAVGFGNWIYAACFSRGSVFRQSQDFKKITVSINETKNTNHPTRKPTQFMQWIIETFSDCNDLVIDPFAGSGQTLFVCEATNRRCITGEIEPAFCAEIIDRWEAMTGKKGILANG